MEVKNMLYAGLGLGNMVSKKTYEHYKKMIEEGKTKDSTLSSSLESFFETLDGQKQDVKDKVANAFQTIADKLGYVKIEDYEYLQKQIKNLEADLAKEKSKTK
jgi:polyhydroxyalkanoate synthesis regulator phasin